MAQVSDNILLSAETVQEGDACISFLAKEVRRKDDRKEVRNEDGVTFPPSVRGRHHSFENFYVTSANGRRHPHCVGGAERAMSSRSGEKWRVFIEILRC